MIHYQRTLSCVIAASLLAFAGTTLAAKPDDPSGKQASHQKGQQKKAHHQNGKQLLGEKIKTNGRHDLEKKGAVTASVDVKDGKIFGMHAKHDTKGELPVKKYKSNQKMARADGSQGATRLMTVQYEYMGTTYIGYAYYDDYGDEQIYWFPVDMIYDGDTGAIEYVPVS
jgi:hypothetical protein